MSPANDDPTFVIFTSTATSALTLLGAGLVLSGIYTLLGMPWGGPVIGLAMLALGAAAELATRTARQRERRAEGGRP